jgi:hypothetical protein
LEALYAVIVAVAFAKDRFGTRWLYVVAALYGLTDTTRSRSPRPSCR